MTVDGSKSKTKIYNLRDREKVEINMGLGLWVACAQLHWLGHIENTYEGYRMLDYDGIFTSISDPSNKC